MAAVPRVSADHLEARRDEIVRAALRRFAEDGFHATSVRDVIQESGLSAGAVYNYFPSKAELIAGAVERILEQLTGALDEAVAGDTEQSPTEAAAGVLRHVLPVVEADGVDYTRIAVTAWAEALRDPAVSAIAERVYGTVRRGLAQLVVRWRDAGHLPEDVDVEALAQVLLSTLMGFVVQHAVLGDVDLDGYATALALLLPRRSGA
jgi:AcrR family transcriptional regulator